MAFCFAPNTCNTHRSRLTDSCQTGRLGLPWAGKHRISLSPSYTQATPIQRHDCDARIPRDDLVLPPVALTNGSLR